MYVKLTIFMNDCVLTITDCQYNVTDDITCMCPKNDTADSFCLLVPSAHSQCKQFGPRSGPTKYWKLLETLMVFLEEFLFEKVCFGKNQQTTKSMNIYLSYKRVRGTI